MPRWPKKNAAASQAPTFTVTEAKAKRATFSIVVNEWDTAQGRFVERPLEAISQVAFNLADGSQISMKFASRQNAPGTAVDVMSTTGSLSVHPIANNMIVLEGKTR